MGKNAFPKVTQKSVGVMDIPSAQGLWDQHAETQDTGSVAQHFPPAPAEHSCFWPHSHPQVTSTLILSRTVPQITQLKCGLLNL